MIKRKNEAYFEPSFENVRSILYKDISSRKNQGFIDCCKKYSFIRNCDALDFNSEMNRLGIVSLVLNEEYNYTQILEEDIINPIQYGSNITIGIIGDTGTGKSELAQTISLISKDANKEYKNRNVDLHLCWTMSDLHNKLSLLKKGDIIWKDEMPKTHGKGSRIEKETVDNVLHTIRKMENTFIFVDPLNIRMSLCNLYLKSAGMNFETRTNRFMLLNKRKEFFGHIYVKLHKDHDLREWYEGEKNNFIQQTIKSGGRFKVSKEDTDLEQEEINDKLQEELEVLNINYNSRNKERDILIYRIKQEGESMEIISKIFNLDIQTIYDLTSRMRKYIK